MKRQLKACLLTLLILIAFSLPVSAGGWAVISLEDWPASPTVGNPVTVQFSVRQHGIRLLEDIDTSISLRKAQTLEKLRIDAMPVSGKAGFYEATLSFPSGGTWEWSIQAFGMDQRMPDLEVRAEVEPSIPEVSSEPARNPTMPVTAGIGGLLVAGGLTAVLLRRQARWAFATILLGFLIGGAGLASAAFQLNKGENQPQPISNLPDPTISGADLFVAKGCLNCHTNHKIDSKYVAFNTAEGPDLSNFKASPDYLRNWLRDPVSVRTNANMPNLGLDDAEIEALIAFINYETGMAEESQDMKMKAEIPVTATPAPIKSSQTTQAACSKLERQRGLLMLYSRNEKSFLSMIDPSTGLPICNTDRLSLGILLEKTYSADKLGVAVLSAETSEYKHFRLSWVDLQGWKVIDTDVVLPAWSQGLAIHPDKSQVAIIQANMAQEAEPRLLGYTLVQVNLSKKVTMNQVEIDIAPRLVTYIDGGRHILIYGVEYDYIKGSTISNARIELYRTSDLSPAWKIELNNVLEGVIHTGKGNSPDQFTQWTPALVLSPDRQSLYIVHADSDQLTTVDLIDRTIRTVEIRPHLSWLEGLISFTAKTAQAKVLNGTTKQAILSPNGTTLYVTGFTGLPSVDANGNWLWETIPLGLQKIDVASGEEMDRVNNETQEISHSGDGATLYLHGWIADGVNWTEIVNAGDLELIQRIERQFLQPAQTQDGKRLVLSSTDGSWAHRFKVIDAVLLKDIAAIEGKGYQISLP